MNVYVTSSVCEAQTTRRHNVLVQPSQKNPRSIDRTPPCIDRHRRNPPLRSKPSIAAFLSDPASSDFPTITVDCSSQRTTRSQRQLQLATKRRLLPCSPPLTSASPVKPPAGDRRPHSYTGDFDLTATGSFFFPAVSLPSSPDFLLFPSYPLH
uniref:Uncharacterized protein n=1 Tax=Lactuca sativa TaxID=4236 RepID=A0A9R1WY29_LACSA|nr:hypothetical protein LSAT_V11C800395880 [Lactuca sativa]